MPRRRSVWIAVAVAIALAGLVGGALLRKRSFDDGPIQPALQRAADISIIDPNGKVLRLGDVVKPGRPTVISLWATWCGPCRLEAPTIVELREEFGPRINLVYLNVRDEGAGRPELNAFLQDVGLPPDSFIRMPSSQIGRLTASPNVLIPRTLVYDAEGNAVARITGYNPLALARVSGLLKP